MYYHVSLYAQYYWALGWIFEIVNIVHGSQLNQDTPPPLQSCSSLPLYFTLSVQYHSTQSVAMLLNILLPFVFSVALHIRFSSQQEGNNLFW